VKARHRKRILRPLAVVSFLTLAVCSPLSCRTGMFSDVAKAKDVNVSATVQSPIYDGERIEAVLTISNPLPSAVMMACRTRRGTEMVRSLRVIRDGVCVHARNPRIVDDPELSPGELVVLPGKRHQLKYDLRDWSIDGGWRPGTYMVEISLRIHGWIKEWIPTSSESTVGAARFVIEPAPQSADP